MYAQQYKTTKSSEIYLSSKYLYWTNSLYIQHQFEKFPETEIKKRL